MMLWKQLMHWRWCTVVGRTPKPRFVLLALVLSVCAQFLLYNLLCCNLVAVWFGVNRIFAPVNPLKPKSSNYYILPYRPNLPFLISDIRALWRSVLSARVPECQKLKTGRLGLHGAEHSKCNHMTTLGFKGLSAWLVRCPINDLLCVECDALPTVPLLKRLFGYFTKCPRQNWWMPNSWLHGELPQQ